MPNGISALVNPGGSRTSTRPQEVAAKPSIWAGLAGSARVDIAELPSRQSVWVTMPFDPLLDASAYSNDDSCWPKTLRASCHCVAITDGSR